MSGKTESWLTPGRTAAMQPNRKNDSRLVRYLAADVARFQKLNEPQFGTEAV